jgi:hypothetical protein
MLELHDRFGTCWRGSYKSISPWHAISMPALKRTIRNGSVVCLLVEAVRCERIGDARKTRLDETIVDWVVEAL